MNFIRRLKFIRNFDDESCGIIMFNKNTKNILITQSVHSDRWGFPKGHVNFWENRRKGAIREVEEEIGINLNVNDLYNDEINMYYKFYITKERLNDHINWAKNIGVNPILKKIGYHTQKLSFFVANIDLDSKEIQDKIKINKYEIKDIRILPISDAIEKLKLGPSNQFPIILEFNDKYFKHHNVQ